MRNTIAFLVLVSAIAFLSGCASQRLGGAYYQCGDCMCSKDGQGRYCN